MKKQNSLNNNFLQSDSIGYTGKINIIIKKNNNIIFKKNFHNNGGTALFEFLSNCIAGSKYNEANAPRYVKLFTINSPSSISPSGEITDNSTPLCSSIYLNASEIIKDSTTNFPAVYLHFTIPCSSLTSSSSGDTTAYMYQAGLYSANYAGNDSKKRYCACFDFTKDGEWSPIALSSANGDYTIFIEWTLSFTNN